MIGLVAFLLLLAKLTIYGAELNPVLARRFVAPGPAHVPPPKPTTKSCGRWP